MLEYLLCFSVCHVDLSLFPHSKYLYQYHIIIDVLTVSIIKRLLSVNYSHSHTIITLT